MFCRPALPPSLGSLWVTRPTSQPSRKLIHGEVLSEAQKDDPFSVKPFMRTKSIFGFGEQGHINCDVLTLTSFVVLAKNLDVYGPRAVAGGRRLM